MITQVFHHVVYDVIQLKWILVNVEISYFYSPFWTPVQIPNEKKDIPRSVTYFEGNLEERTSISVGKVENWDRLKKPHYHSL